MTTIQEGEKLWRQARPIMKNTPSQLFEYLRIEVDEAEAELESPEKLGAELADIYLFVCAIANEFDIDVELVARKKLVRNHLKYPASELQDGDYQEKRKALRAWWDQNGDDTV